MAGSGGVRSLGRPGRAGRCGYCHDLTTCPQQGMAEKQTWLLHRRRAVLGGSSRRAPAKLESVQALTGGRCPGRGPPPLPPLETHASAQQRLN